MQNTPARRCSQPKVATPQNNIIPYTVRSTLWDATFRLCNVIKKALH
jgi:hypothetical protein